MVAIGLGLMSRPRVMMIDEPSAGLSVGAVSSIASSLADLAQRSALPLLLVEQNLGVAERLCTRFLIFESGGRLAGGAATFDDAVALLESATHGAIDLGGPEPGRHGHQLQSPASP